MVKKIQIKGVNVYIVDTAEHTGNVAGEIVLKQLNLKPNSLLGFPTGKSPKPLFSFLINDLKNGSTDWSKATVTNVDEWVNHKSINSCRFDIDQDFFRFLGNTSKLYLPGPPYKSNSCIDFDQKIVQHGGYDLLVLGVGTNGHLGFCEPGTSFETKTHIAEISVVTTNRYIKRFGGVSKVPKVGSTIGIRTILDAKKIVLIAFGKEKVEAIKEALYSAPNPSWPVSCLQMHKDVHFVLDAEAAKALS